MLKTWRTKNFRILLIFLNLKVKIFIFLSKLQIEIASIRKSSSASDSFATPKRNALMSRTRPNTGKENADPFSTQSQAYDSPPKVVSATPLAMKRKKNFAGFTFHYNQGSSQAIRRNIRIDSLFFKWAWLIFSLN